MNDNTDFKLEGADRFLDEVDEIGSRSDIYFPLSCSIQFNLGFNFLPDCSESIITTV